jgi:glycosyltransferase involved in cell wall biosynthesis
VIKFKEEELDKGDRILAHQYLVHSFLKTGKFDKAIKYGLASLYLDPERAEFYCFLADAYAAGGNLKASIPYYMAAKSCNPPPPGFTKIFHAPVCYFYHPTFSLAKVYFHLGELEMAIHELSKLDSKEAKEFLDHCKRMDSMQDISQAIDNDDIVISCMPGPYRWDEKIYETKGLGGSETAAVEMAKNLASQTNRKVIVFNDRDEPLHMKHGALGVEYRPSKEAMDYFKKWKPVVHIAWRHNIKLTDAKTYLWCHDLVTPGAENTSIYEKIICLSEFHKSYVQSCQAIPDEKIWISRNGIEPERFFKEMPPRQYGKVIWSNSPDRGLEHAIAIMDLVKESIPSVELHIFYGWENLYKYGLAEKADMLKAMVEARPWIKYIGNVDQARLTREVASSDVWLYPATFIESFCISALEALCCGTWSVVRKIGALRDTLSEAEKNGFCDLVDVDPSTIEGRVEYARLVSSAIIDQKHYSVKDDPKKYAWSSVAKEWIEEMKL